MEKTNRNLIVGVFTIIGLGLLVIAIFFIGSNKNLFSSSFRLKTYFVNVAGLQTGTSVTYAGINVGSVTEINIIKSDQIEVIMSIKTDVRKFIKEDSKVSIVSEGLVGSKIMEISAGSNSSPVVENDAIITSVKPISTEDIMKSLKETSDNAINISKDFADISARINRGEGTIGQLLKNDTMYQSINTVLKNFSTYSKDLNMLFGNMGSAVQKISTDFDALTAELTLSVKNVTEITNKLNSNQSFIGTLLTDTSFANNLKGTIESIKFSATSLEKGAFSFNQNMEALKHNFFFKGYFEDIGYWDKESFEIEYEKRIQQIKRSQKTLDSLQNAIEQKQKELKK